MEKISSDVAKALALRNAVAGWSAAGVYVEGSPKHQTQRPSAHLPRANPTETTEPVLLRHMAETAVIPMPAWRAAAESVTT